MRADTGYCPGFSGPFIAFVHCITQILERACEPPTAKASPRATLIARKLLKTRCQKFLPDVAGDFTPFGAQ